MERGHLAMAVEGRHGITENTAKNVLFGAGTYHKGMSFDKATGVLSVGTVIGATQGGGGVEVKGEVVHLELDGAYVKFKGQAIMCGGSATIEASFAELTPEVMAMGIVGKTEAKDKATVITPKTVIEEGDYVDGFGFVGMTADGKRKVAVILESALCTSGVKIEPKHKEGAVVKLTMEAYAEHASNLDEIPVKIIFMD